MNSLSWLIYLADITGDIEGLLTGVFVFGLVGLVLTSIGYFMMSGDNYCASEFEACRKFIKLAWPIVLICGVLVAVIPARKTIMFIAASEFGEEIAQSNKAQNVGNKAYRALDKMLSEYLDAGKPE